MENIGDYLKKFTGFLNSKQQSQKIVIAEIKKSLGIDIDKQNIEIKDATVYIKESPILKSSIFMNKRRIIESLQKAGLKINDIR